MNLAPITTSHTGPKWRTCVLQAVGCETVACARALALHALSPGPYPSHLLKGLAGGTFHEQFRGEATEFHNRYVDVLQGSARFYRFVHFRTRDPWLEAGYGAGGNQAGNDGLSKSAAQKFRSSSQSLIRQFVEIINSDRNVSSCLNGGSTRNEFRCHRTREHIYLAGDSARLKPIMADELERGDLGPRYSAAGARHPSNHSSCPAHVEYLDVDPVHTANARVHSCTRLLKLATLLDFFAASKSDHVLTVTARFNEGDPKPNEMYRNEKASSFAETAALFRYACSSNDDPFFSRRHERANRQRTPIN